MDEIQKKKCHKIIHAASLSAAAVCGGMASLPIPDSTALVPIQTAMVIALGKVFDKKLDEGAAKAIATQYITAQIGQTVSRFLIGKIPVAGNVINASTAASLTEAYGWTIANEFAKDGEIVELLDENGNRIEKEGFDLKDFKWEDLNTKGFRKKKKLLTDLHGMVKNTKKAE